MLLTEGFGDLLTIRHQARPSIFDLKNARLPPLADRSVEVGERTYLTSESKMDVKEKVIGDGKVYVK